ncbi:MAG: hypothetical protein DRP00_04475 [Candidatus Aenigmatarchaeota archaeon]|nr:MAG: hypothetical protein DRP00_04475 [Candidatus Aenigmarchaeota archaeon]
MREREMILRFTCFGIIAGILSQYLLKSFENLIFSLVAPLAIFLILILFSRKKEHFLTNLITFFSVWFVFWMILYGL